MVSVFLWLNVKRFQGRVNTHGRSGAARKTRVSLLVLYSRNREKASRNAEKNGFSPNFAEKNAFPRHFPAGSTPGSSRETWRIEEEKPYTHAQTSFPRFRPLSI